MRRAVHGEPGIQPERVLDLAQCRGPLLPTGACLGQLHAGIVEHGDVDIRPGHGQFGLPAIDARVRASGRPIPGQHGAIGLFEIGGVQIGRQVEIVLVQPAEIRHPGDIGGGIALQLVLQLIPHNLVANLFGNHAMAGFGLETLGKFGDGFTFIPVLIAQKRDLIGRSRTG